MCGNKLEIEIAAVRNGAGGHVFIKYGPGDGVGGVNVTSVSVQTVPWFSLMDWITKTCWQLSVLGERQ